MPSSQIIKNNIKIKKNGKININKKVEIESKRFYLPVTFSKPCPVCGNLCTANLGKHYLSYPSLNYAEEVSIYCETCDDWFNKTIILRMQIEIL